MDEYVIFSSKKYRVYVRIYVSHITPAPSGSVIEYICELPDNLFNPNLKTYVYIMLQERIIDYMRDDYFITINSTYYKLKNNETDQNIIETKIRKYIDYIKKMESDAKHNLETKLDHELKYKSLMTNIIEKLK